jgi:hypothetical protein
MRGVSAAALITALLLNAPSHAADKLTGRWAADPSICAGNLLSEGPTPFVFTSYAVRWQGDSCRIGRIYKAGDTTYIQAFCWAISGERSIPVSLRPHGGQLALTWDRTAHADLRRCP